MSYQTSRQVALDHYLVAFDKWLKTPSIENGAMLDHARASWALEIALDEAQQRLAV